MYAELEVEVLDHESYGTGRMVPVTVCYVREVDADYGSDADGRRGICLISYDVVGCTTTKTLLREEEKQVFADAVTMFLNNPGKFGA